MTTERRTVRIRPIVPMMAPMMIVATGILFPSELSRTAAGAMVVCGTK
jgi:hypothetical protein